MFDISIKSLGNISLLASLIFITFFTKIQVAETPSQGIYVWVLGQADVSWSEKPGGKRTTFEYELYMKHLVTLFGKEPGGKGCHHKSQPLPAGHHEYGFEVKLPKNLPSSFESQDLQYKGRVHYMIRTRLDSPNETLRQIRDRTFIVLSILDLNKETRVSESVQLRKDKFVCCCCCKSGPVSCVLRLDRTGYVPGEDINLDAELQNCSRKEVTASYVTMQQGKSCEEIEFSNKAVVFQQEATKYFNSMEILYVRKLHQAMSCDQTSSV